MSRISTLFALLTAVLLFLPIAASAQAGVAKESLRRAVDRNRPIRRQTQLVAAELERQQRFLRNITSRYEAVAGHDLTPLLQYQYVWNALRENRGQLSDPRSRMSSSQSRELFKGYDLLEKEMLQSFADYQLGILSDVLELNYVQLEEITGALNADLNKKRKLLSDKTITPETFQRKLEWLSGETEKRILAILFPEQRKIFYKQVTFNRDRFVG